MPGCREPIEVCWMSDWIIIGAAAIGLACWIVGHVMARRRR